MENRATSNPVRLSSLRKLCGVSIAGLMLCGVCPPLEVVRANSQAKGEALPPPNLTVIERYGLEATIKRAREIPDPNAIIGSAKISRKGVITLDLIAEREDGTIPHATLVRKPGDPDYASILKHIGPIKPGKSKPVYPFPKEAAVP